MRKIVKGMAAVAMVMLVAMSFMACGVTGKYKHEMKLADLAGVLDIGFGEAKVIITLELEKDDKFSTTVGFKDLSEKATELATKLTSKFKISGTYKVDGEKIVFTVGGVDSEGTIKGNKITGKLFDKMEFKK